MANEIFERGKAVLKAYVEHHLGHATDVSVYHELDGFQSGSTVVWATDGALALLGEAGTAPLAVLDGHRGLGTVLARSPRPRLVEIDVDDDGDLRITKPTN
jgi:hypothetical protein